VGAVAGSFIFFRNTEDIVDYTNFATLLVFAGVNASAIKIFAKNKAAGQPVHILADFVLPSAGVIASLWLAVNIGWEAALFGAILLATGVLALFVFKRMKSGMAKPN
jgi:hypothetical protein